MEIGTVAKVRHNIATSQLTSGAYGTRATCPNSGVEYYDLFKDACPLSYAVSYWTFERSLS
jgi:hypothetical protein